VLLLMSIAFWALIVIKGWARWQRRRRNHGSTRLADAGTARDFITRTHHEGAG